MTTLVVQEPWRWARDQGRAVLRTLADGASSSPARRRRDRAFRPAGIETFEPRIVPSGGMTVQPTVTPSFVIYFTGVGQQQGLNGVTATIPQQQGSNQICTTITNNGPTPQAVTFALFNDPDPTVQPAGGPGDAQTLAASQTVTLPSGGSQTICLTVAAGKCYQADSLLGSAPPTVGGSTAINAPFQFTSDYLTYTRFCVPATLTPPPTGTCFTQGYYKNHPSAVSSLLASQGGVLQVGGVSYTTSELIAILQTPPQGGESRLILVHQLITAKLNVLGGCTATGIPQLIAQGDALLSGVNLLSLSGLVQNSAMDNVANQLDIFNNSSE